MTTPQLAALHAISRAVSSPSGLEEVLTSALKEAMDLIRNASGWICLLGDDDLCQVCVRAGGTDKAELGQDY